MTDQQELDILKQNQPDLVAAIRALVKEELQKWANARRDAVMQEIRFIERELMPKKPAYEEDRLYKIDLSVI